MTHKNTASLEQHPFTLLWITNCVLYSALIAFPLYKGWRKKKRNFPRKQETLRNGNERKVRDPAGETAVLIGSKSVNKQSESDQGRLYADFKKIIAERVRREDRNVFL